MTDQMEYIHIHFAHNYKNAMHIGIYLQLIPIKTNKNIKTHLQKQKNNIETIDKQNVDCHTLDGSIHMVHSTDGSVRFSGLADAFLALFGAQ